MIKYALICDNEHAFEAWFGVSSDFDEQAARGLIEYPHCGSLKVRKALMAPAVKTARAKEARREASAARAMAEMASKVQAHIRKNYDYVGGEFAAEATAMHEGEKPERLIYGETTPEESEALREAGVPAAPLPDAFAPTPPKKAN